MTKIEIAEEIDKWVNEAPDSRTAMTLLMDKADVQSFCTRHVAGKWMDIAAMLYSVMVHEDSVASAVIFAVNAYREYKTGKVSSEGL